MSGIFCIPQNGAVITRKINVTNGNTLIVNTVLTVDNENIF